MLDQKHSLDFQGTEPPGLFEYPSTLIARRGPCVQSGQAERQTTAILSSVFSHSMPERFGNAQAARLEHLPQFERCQVGRDRTGYFDDIDTG